jgi:hypothetical protein
VVCLSPPPTEAQDAQRATTAGAEAVHRLGGIGVDADRFDQLKSQRQVPRRSDPRLLEVEVSAHTRQVRVAGVGDGCEQVAQRQLWAAYVPPLAPWFVCIYPWSRRCLRRVFRGRPPSAPHGRAGHPGSVRAAGAPK